MELLGDRGAAEHATPLEHADVLARGGEIRGADEAVVTAADDDGVEAPGGRRSHERALRRTVAATAARVSPRRW